MRAKHIPLLGQGKNQLLGPITDRILLVVVLVVILGRVEHGCGQDLGGDGFREGFRCFESLLGLLAELFLFLVMVEDGGTILRSLVAKLPASVGWVDVPAEDL